MPTHGSSATSGWPDCNAPRLVRCERLGQNAAGPQASPVMPAVTAVRYLFDPNNATDVRSWICFNPSQTEGREMLAYHCWQTIEFERA